MLDPIGLTAADDPRSRAGGRRHANVHAAFVIDPDGHNVEAVRHAPEATA
jgi:hypothetical protein